MSSRPNPLRPSPSNLSNTLTRTHTHYQHISPHRNLPHCVQAGSGNPTAKETYIKYFSYRKLQTSLSPSIHSENTWTSWLQHKWFRMQPHDWSLTTPIEPMLHLSLSPCTGYQLQLASSSRHWCLHIEQPQAQHPPTSAHYYKSTTPPEVWDLLVSDASWYHQREAQNHSP